MCTGAPCTAGKRDVTWTARTTWPAGTGRIDTTIGPWNAPAGTVGTDVMYIGTFEHCSMCRTGMPASSSADSNVKLQPIRNDTRSSLHSPARSTGSSASTPSR